MNLTPSLEVLGAPEPVFLQERGRFAQSPKYAQA